MNGISIIIQDLKKKYGVLLDINTDEKIPNCCFIILLKSYEIL